MYYKKAFLLRETAILNTSMWFWKVQNLLFVFVHYALLELEEGWMLKG